MRLEKLMEGRVDCQVSGRWLQFPPSASVIGKGGGATHALMIVDVMTMDANDKERKLCELALAREDLLLMALVQTCSSARMTAFA